MSDSTCSVCGGKYEHDPYCPGQPPERRKTALQHGVMCPKAPHTKGDGYLHHGDDDGPYWVDNVTYCGRCHFHIVL